MALSPEGFAGSVLAWYREVGRDLPWRRTRDPYAVLVSEVMLQQTQVERVVPRYLAWLERWPTAEALAAAPLADVIGAWSGLGYNRRAVSLHRAAVAVARDGWPRDTAGLRRLPGIGPYTASALAVQAFGADELPVDVNVRRVLERALGATRIEPAPGTAWELTQALFDLGATVCVARRPRCGACPLADGCPSRGRTYEPLRRQGPFEGSRRQARGALLRRLAAGPVAVAEIDDPGLAEDLARDGLAAIREGLVSLP
jgi:A/G-specific adenine glycosylase